MDKILENALNDVSESDSNMEEMFSSPSSSSINNNLNIMSPSNENDNGLIHTVSFYRKQQPKSVKLFLIQSKFFFTKILF